MSEPICDLRGATAGFHRPDCPARHTNAQLADILLDIADWADAERDWPTWPGALREAAKRLQETAADIKGEQEP